MEGRDNEAKGRGVEKANYSVSGHHPMSFSRLNRRKRWLDERHAEDVKGEPVVFHIPRPHRKRIDTAAPLEHRNV